MDVDQDFQLSSPSRPDVVEWQNSQLVPTLSTLLRNDGTPTSRSARRTRTSPLAASPSASLSSSASSSRSFRVEHRPSKVGNKTRVRPRLSETQAPRTPSLFDRRGSSAFLEALKGFSEQVDETVNMRRQVLARTDSGREITKRRAVNGLKATSSIHRENDILRIPSNTRVSTVPSLKGKERAQQVVLEALQHEPNPPHQSLPRRDPVMIPPPYMPAVQPPLSPSDPFSQPRPCMQMPQEKDPPGVVSEPILHPLLKLKAESKATAARNVTSAPTTRNTVNSTQQTTKSVVPQSTPFAPLRAPQSQAFLGMRRAYTLPSDKVAPSNNTTLPTKQKSFKPPLRFDSPELSQQSKTASARAQLSPAGTPSANSSFSGPLSMAHSVSSQHRMAVSPSPAPSMLTMTLKAPVRKAPTPSPMQQRPQPTTESRTLSGEKSRDQLSQSGVARSVSGASRTTATSQIPSQSPPRRLSGAKSLTALPRDSIVSAKEKRVLTRTHSTAAAEEEGEDDDEVCVDSDDPLSPLLIPQNRSCSPASSSYGDISYDMDLLEETLAQYD